MSVSVQVSFRNLSPRPTAEEMIRKKAAKLETFYDRILGIEVQVEVPHRHQHKGNHYHVRVGVSVPGHQFVVSRQSGDDRSEENLTAAISNAFKAARRELQDYVALQRDQTRQTTELSST